MLKYRRILFFFRIKREMNFKKVKISIITLERFNH